MVLLYIDGSVQDYSNSSVLAMKLLQSWAQPSIWLVSSHYQYVVLDIDESSHLSVVHCERPEIGHHTGRQQHVTNDVMVGKTQIFNILQRKRIWIQVHTNKEKYHFVW